MSAQEYRIILKLDLLGLDLIKEVKNELRAVKEDFLSQPFKIFGGVEESIKDISKALTTISTKFESILDSSRNKAEKTFSSINKTASQTIDSLSTRILRLSSFLLFQIGQEYIQKAIKIFSLKKAFSELSLTVLNINRSFEILNPGLYVEQIAAIGSSISGISSLLTPLEGALNTIFFITARISGIAYTFASHSLILLLINTSLKETIGFFQRLIGFGFQTTSLTDRIKGVIEVIDGSIKNVSLNVGDLVKSITLGGVFLYGWAAGPLAAIITSFGFINSLITFATHLFTRGALQGLAFLGSGKSQLQLLFLNIKNIAVTALPILQDKSKAFITMHDNSQKADKQIGYIEKHLLQVGGNFEKFIQLTTIRRANLPIQQQFALLATELRGVSKELITQGNQFIVMIGKIFGISDEGMKQFRAQAISTSQATIKEISTNSKAIEAVFQKPFARHWYSSFLEPIESIKSAWRNRSLFLIPLRDVSTLTLGLKQAEDQAKSAVKQLGIIGDTTKKISISPIARALPTPIKTFEIESTKEFSRSIEYVNVLLKLTREQFLLISKVIDLSTTQVKILGLEIKNSLHLTSESLISTKQLQQVFLDAETVIKRLPSEVEKIGKNLDFTNVKAQIKSISEDLFKLQNTPIKGSGAVSLAKERGETGLGRGYVPTGLGKDFPNAVNQVFAALRGFNEGDLSIESIEKRILHFEKVAKRIAENLGGEAKKNVEDFLKSFSSKTFKPIPQEEFKKMFSGLEASINNLRSIFGIQAKGLGNDLTKALSESLATGKGRLEVEKALNDLTGLIDAFFPHSPAKRGPLRSIPQWGPEINAQIAQGIRKGTPTTLKAVDDLTEGIAKYFPRSLALLGALVKLPLMGFKIPFQIAEGILSGLGVIESAVRKMVDVIAKAAGKASETQNIADRFGISPEVLSSMEYAIATVGGSLSDLTFTLNSFQRVLSSNATKEEVEKFEKLGISIAKAKVSGKPFESLLYQIADGLKEAGAGSERFGSILEAAGFTTQSNFVNVLLKGSTALKELQTEAIESGTVLSKETGKLAQEFVAISNKFTTIKNTFLNSILTEILPVINETGNEILQIFRDNQTIISSIMRVLGSILAQGLRQVIHFFKVMVAEPKLAFQLILDLFDVFLKGLGNILDIGFGLAKNAFSSFFKELAPLATIGILQLSVSIAAGFVDLVISVFGLVGDSIKGAFVSLTATFSNYFQDFLFDIMGVISKTAQKIPFLSATFSKLFGVEILPQKTIEVLKKQAQELNETQEGVADTLRKLALDFAVKQEKSIGEKTSNFFKGIFKEEDQKKLKDSLNEAVEDVSKAIEKINKKTVIIADLNNSISKIGNTLRSGFEKVFGSILSPEMQQKILGGLGFVRDEFIGTVSSIVSSEPAQYLKTLFVGKVEEQKQKINELKEAQKSAILENSGMANKVLDELEAKKLTLAKIPLLSEGTLLSTQNSIDKFASKLAEIKPLEEFLGKALEVDPFLGLKVSLEAMSKATAEQLPLIQDEILNAFNKVIEKDPFIALKKSLEILKDNIDNEKDTLGANIFSKAISSLGFKEQIQRDPKESINQIKNGFQNTSEGDISSLRDPFLQAFTEASEKDPFGSLAASFDIFVTESGEKGKLAGEAFSIAFKASTKLLGDTLTGVGDLVSLVFGKTSKAAKAFFIAQKALAVAEATINIALGITKAIAQGGIAGVIAGVGVAAAGAVQIATITAQQMPTAQKGGLLTGKSHAQGGIPIEAEGGEFVIRKRATEFYGSAFLEALNNQQLPKPPQIQGIGRYEFGGSVGGESLSTSFSSVNQQPQVINITNIPDTQSAIDRYFSQGRGEQTLLNIMGNRASQVRERIGLR